MSQESTDQTTAPRSKHGWFNWYVNRGRLALVIPKSKAAEREWFKTLRRISHRRTI